jgi:GTP-binding protein
MTQVDVNPPTFCCFINKLDRQNFAFTKWIDNSLRREFGFTWVPLVITFKEKWENDGERGYSQRREEEEDYGPVHQETDDGAYNEDE